MFDIYKKRSNYVFRQHLHQCYEEWLVGEKFGPAPAPVLVLDANQGIESMLKTYEQYTVCRVSSFLVF